MSKIIVNKEICSGAPTINGSRLTVYNIISGLLYSKNTDEYLSDFELSRTDLKNVVNYCSKLECKREEKIYNFCEGCILRSINDGRFKSHEYTEIELSEGSVISYSEKNDEYFLGTINQFDDEDFGKPGWLISEYLKRKFNF
jgi:uncharacterized protein (DUF433 family)